MKDLKIKFRWETEFKETEIGEIPKDWEVEKTIEHIEFIRGIEPGSKFYKDFGKYKFIRVGNLNGERNDEVFIDIEVENEKIANKNDILISFDGTVGVVRKGLEGVFSSGIRKIKIKEQGIAKLNYEFLYWFFKSTIKYQIFGFSDEKTTIAHASDSIPYLKIFILPLPEQSRIATVLSWFDDLIEVKKRQNEILEKIAMAIFKSWFIDFEPFRDGEFVYSEELGKEIPKGWEVKRLYELCKILRGLNFKSNEVIFEYVKGYIPVLRTNNIKGGFEIDFSDLMFVKEDKINPEKLLKENDILSSASNGNPDLVGNFAVFLNTFTDLAFSFGAFIYLIRVNNHEMFPYVYLSLSDNSFREYVASAISGTNINNLNLSDLKSFPVLIPPSHILQSFHSLVEPLFQKIILNQKQIMTLRKIRDNLLPLLVFGKLRVEEV